MVRPMARALRADRRPAPSPAPSTPSQRPRARMATEDRREQLLAEGRALFLEKTYDQVSMDDLAARAGVSKGLVFHYFSTKRDLYVEVVRRAARELCDAMLVTDDADPLTRITRALERYLDHVEQNAKGYVALMAGGVGVDPELAAVLNDVRRKLAEHMLTGLPFAAPAGANVLVRGFLGLVEAASLEWIENKTMQREELIGVFVRSLSAILPAPDASPIQASSPLQNKA